MCAFIFHGYISTSELERKGSLALSSQILSLLIAGTRGGNFHSGSQRVLRNSRKEIIITPLEICSVAVFIYCLLCLHRTCSEQVDTHSRQKKERKCRLLMRPVFAFRAQRKCSPSLCSRNTRVMIKITVIITISYVTPSL